MSGLGINLVGENFAGLKVLTKPKPDSCQLRPETRGLRLPTELSLDPAARYSSIMVTTNKFQCAQCDMSEERCECEKYCCFCQAQIDARLCADGLYYCQACREACDMKPQG